VRTVIIGAALVAGMSVGTLSFGPAIANNFSKQGAPGFPYPKNANGQTYGSAALAPTPDQEPDLISAVGEDDVQGYLRSEDINQDLPKTPQEAVSYMEKHKNDPDRLIPLYASDGKTVIGAFKHSGKAQEITFGEKAVE